MSVLLPIVKKAERFRVLVLGGYGNFGSAIVRRLSGVAGIHVLIGGRDERRAEALARETGGEPVCLDRNRADLAERLSELQVDLADARDFVCGIGELDAEARASGVLICSGASSVPALSSAVIDWLLPRFIRLDRISHGISLSAKMPGRATLAGRCEIGRRSGIFPRRFCPEA